MSKADPPEPPTYRAIKLELRSGGNFTARGLNFWGEVVGDTSDDAILWLPLENYGMGSGSHVLDTSQDTIRVHDINIDGLAVGEVGSLTQAFYWDVAADQSGFLPNLGGSTSKAVRVNDQVPPRIVGSAREPEPDPVELGVRITFFPDPGSPTLQVLEPSPPTPPLVDPWPHSTALDINYGAVAVGRSFQDPSLCGVALCGACHEPTWWPAGSAAGIAMEKLPTDVWVNPGAVPTGINDVGHVIGWGEDPGPDDQCLGPNRALFWRSPIAEPIALPFVPGFDTGNIVPMPTAMSNPDPNGVIVAVGRTDGPGRATLWIGTETGPWAAHHLEDRVFCGFDALSIFDALDINDNGWIVARGTDGQTTASWLLIPSTYCPGDIAGPDWQVPDGKVGVDDLLSLLANWGTDHCHADIDQNGTVNLDDLLILLANWGDCPGFPEQGVPSLEEELNAAGLTMDDWDDFMEVMDSGTPAEQENWNCWMRRYLTQCQNCEPCPGPNPFAD